MAIDPMEDQQEMIHMTSRSVSVHYKTCPISNQQRSMAENHWLQRPT